MHELLLAGEVEISIANCDINKNLTKQRAISVLQTVMQSSKFKACFDNSCINENTVNLMPSLLHNYQ